MGPKEPGFLAKVGRGIAGFAGRIGKESLKHTALALAVPAATFAVSLVAPAAAPAVAVGLGVGAGIAHLATSPKYSAPEKDPSLSERKYKDAAVGKAILAGTTTMMLGGLGAGVLGATAPLIGVGGIALAGAGALYGAVKSIKDQVGEGLHRLGIRKNHETKETLDWLILDRKVELNEDGYYDGDFFFP